MATHNTVRLAGYLLEPPSILNIDIEGQEKAFLKLRTMRRDADDVGPEPFETVWAFYDGKEYMPLIKKLVKYDLVEIKGVFTILPANKPSKCTFCGATNVKVNGTYAFVYPQWVRKIDNLPDQLPDAIITKHYKEVSNYFTLIGVVVSDPEETRIKGEEDIKACKYRVAVNRKYFIPTQPDIHADYPWVYTRGQQAEDDLRHLQQKAQILVDGYIHTRTVQVPITCSECGQEYKYQDLLTDFYPYAVEYLSGHKTDEDIAREEEIQRRLRLSDS